MTRKELEKLAEKLEKERVRVDGDRAALKAKENELMETIRGERKRKNPRSFAIDDVAVRSTENEDMEKVKAIRSALKLPREIDEKYRAAKLEYIEAIIPFLEEVDKRQRETLEAAEKAYKAAKQAYEDAQDESDKIGDEADKLLAPLGLWHNLITGGPSAQKARNMLDTMKNHVD